MNQEPNVSASPAAHLTEMIEVKMNLLASQIRKLAELRDEGLLTDEEFSAAKTQLLAGL
jgi:hypothetical protein